MTKQAWAIIGLTTVVSFLLGLVSAGTVNVSGLATMAGAQVNGWRSVRACPDRT